MAHNLKFPYNVMILILNNPNFNPHITPKNVIWWPSNEFMPIAHVRDDRGILLRQILQAKHQLPTTENHHYTQI